MARQRSRQSRTNFGRVGLRVPDSRSGHRMGKSLQRRACFSHFQPATSAVRQRPKVSFFWLTREPSIDLQIDEEYSRSAEKGNHNLDSTSHTKQDRYRIIQTLNPPHLRGSGVTTIRSLRKSDEPLTKNNVALEEL